MITVHKYEVSLIDSGPGGALDVQMPMAAEILHAGCQFDYPARVQIWARVDDTTNMATRRIYVVGTGHPAPPRGEPIPIGGEHIASIITAAGSLVWHVFDGGEQ